MSEAKTAVQPQAEATEFSDFGALLNKEFKPKSDHAQEAIQTAVKTLAAQALESSVVVSNDVVNTIVSTTDDTAGAIGSQRPGVEPPSVDSHGRGRHAIGGRRRCR